MNHFYLLFSAFLLTQLPVSMANKETVRGHELGPRSIIGGHPAKRYPFYVFVFASGSNANGYGRYCGGTIVGINTVVTAAFCMYLPDNGRKATTDEVHILVSDFTSSNWMETATWRDCSDYVIHPAYYKDKHHDIAVVKIRGQFDFNYNSKLKPCSASATYGKATAIGMGIIRQNPDSDTDVLREAELKNDPGCNSWPKSNKIDQKMLICYSVPGKASVCMGDAGGPLVHKHNGRVVCLLGIASFVGPSCVGDQAGAFIRAGFFADWISAQL